MSISLQLDTQPIASHQISEIKGQVISDPSHRQRAQTKRDRQIAQVYEAMDDTELAAWLVDTLQRQYPRHLTDQLKIVLKSAEQYPQHLNTAVKELNRLGLTSANDLRDIAISLDIQAGRHQSKPAVINEKYKDMTAPERNQEIYLKVLQGDQ